MKKTKVEKINIFVFYKIFVQYDRFYIDDDILFEIMLRFVWLWHNPHEIFGPGGNFYLTWDLSCSPDEK